MIKAVDLSKIIPSAFLSMPAVIDGALRELAEELRSEIIRRAESELNSTAEDYIAGLQPVEYSAGAKSRGGMFGAVADALFGKQAQGSMSIELVGVLPNMIENGWNGGDMKDSLLAGPNAKITKGGIRYNTVPFRHMGPKTTGRHGQPMGSQFQAMLGPQGAADLGKDIQKAASKLKQGQRLPEGLAPKLKSHHVTDIFAGMVKQQQVYAKKTGSQFKTFRRVSENSKPESWIHPGIEAKHFFDDAAKHIETAGPRLVREYILKSIKDRK